MAMSVVIFVISAVAVAILLSIVIALNILRKRYSSTTHYNYKIKKEDHETPNFQFIVPTHVPKTITVQDFGDDDCTVDGSCAGEIDADLIDPELYKNVPELDTNGKNGSTVTSGRLCFNVRYETDTERLIVDLLRGEQIRRRKNSRAVSATPYVKVCLLPDKKKLQTKTRRSTSNPLFNEQFIFQCPFTGLKERSLRFTVCDFDRFSRQSAVGKVLFPLEECYEKILTEDGCEEIWCDIEDCGTCEVENSYIGEILFSLQYLPAAKRLAITVMKGKGFAIEGSSKIPSVHVKIAMVFGGKTVHIRKTAKKASNEPVFNESFHFDLPLDSLERTSFVLTITNNKLIIGRCFVGPPMYVTGTGLNHWNSMLNSPRNAVAMWHALS